MACIYFLLFDLAPFCSDEYQNTNFSFLNMSIPQELVVALCIYLVLLPVTSIYIVLINYHSACLNFYFCGKIC